MSSTYPAEQVADPFDVENPFPLLIQRKADQQSLCSFILLILANYELSIHENESQGRYNNNITKIDQVSGFKYKHKKTLYLKLFECIFFPKLSKNTVANGSSAHKDVYI